MIQLWNIKTWKSLFASIIWNASEYFHIPLGRFAPYVFHVMIGATEMKLIKKDQYENKTRTNRKAI
jgi:hypothetical protein